MPNDTFQLTTYVVTVRAPQSWDDNYANNIDAHLPSKDALKHAVELLIITTFNEDGLGHSLNNLEVVVS